MGSGASTENTIPEHLREEYASLLAQGLSEEEIITIMADVEKQYQLIKKDNPQFSDHDINNVLKEKFRHLTSPTRRGFLSKTLDEVSEDMSSLFLSTPPTFRHESHANMAPPTHDDLLLGMKMAALCQITYFVKSPPDPARQELEREWVRRVSARDYQVWSTVSEENARLTSKFFGGALAISCILDDIAPNLKGPSVCVSFRGTKSISDMAADLSSMIITDLASFITNKKVGRTGRGFITHLQALLQVNKDGQNLFDYVVSVAKEKKCRVLIAGHSLGAAVGNLFGTMLYNDCDADSRPAIGLITFGSPRTFVESSAESVDNYSYRHLRFVNDGDLITTLGDEADEPLMHTGEAIFCSKVATEGQLVSIDGSAKNFPPNPPHVLDSVSLMSTFIYNKAQTHRMGCKGGYIDAMVSSSNYTSALASIADDEAMKASFDNIYSKFEPSR